MLAFPAVPAQAQMTPPSAAGAKPKPVTTVPIRPALQKPEETANAMGQAERLALQSDLAWVGQYNGAITGDVSERMVNAIKEFQKGRGGKPTGVLNPQERGVLADTAQAEAGKCRLEDRHRSRHRRAARHPDQTGAPAGQRRQRHQMDLSTGTVQVQLARRKEANPTTAKLAEREKKEPGRTVDYTVVKPDFFVLSGLQGLKKFYMRGTFKGDEVRILTILYDQATENTVEPVVIAMSSAFNAFPAGTQAAGPPPRKTVEYGTGDRRRRRRHDPRRPPDHRRLRHGRHRGLRQCRSHRRGQGTRSRAAAHLRRARTEAAQSRQRRREGRTRPYRHHRSAEPGRRRRREQRQGVDRPARWRRRSCVSPAPALGFSGAAALDDDGKFAGIAVMKPVQVAGPANGSAAAQAVLVAAETVRGFLKANGVNASGGSQDAKVAVVA